MDNLMAAKSQLDTRELLLLDSEVKNRGKSMLVAYILWYFLGFLGAHRFYIGKKGSAITQLILTITIVGLIVNAVWWIVDAFLLHGYIKEKNQQVEEEVLNRLLTDRQQQPPHPSEL